MNRRHLAFVFGGMVAAGSATICVPLLIDGRRDTRADARRAALAPTDSFQHHHFERLIENPDGVLYGIARDEGLLISYDRGHTWTPRNNGLPQKLIYPYLKPMQRELTSVTIDAFRPGRIAVTTPRELHVSEDNGQSWTRIATDRADPKNDEWPAASDHFTSASFDPINADGFLLGTSFGGFYATSNRGRTWTDVSRKAEFLKRGAGMYEEVAGIAWLPPEAPWAAAAAFDAGTSATPDRRMVIAEGFGGAIHLWDPVTQEAHDLGFPGSSRREQVQSVWVALQDGATQLTVSTNRSVWSYEGEWSRLGAALIAEQPPAEPDAAKLARMRKASDRTGIYLGSLQAANKHIDRYLDLVVRNGMSTIVVDCKEDFGIVTYDSRLELPQKVGAVKVRFRLDELLTKAHDRGVYVVGRVLVFKDRLMYSYENYAHAVWDRDRNAAWAYLLTYEDDETGEKRLYQREHWIDPFDSFVVDYNIAIARELQDRGIDEIQFDYIRFPTDGNLSSAVYRHRRTGMNNVDALESFLAKAREAIDIPISTDLYGFNSWHQMGTTNGQSISVFSRYVDVVCPMFYPSHFPSSFMRNVPYFDRAARIYEQGTERAQILVAGSSLVRPYVQAFLLRSLASEADLDAAQAGVLLFRQIDGAREAAASGYTLWNASNDYYMVTRSLAGYQTGM